MACVEGGKSRKCSARVGPPGRGRNSPLYFRHRVPLLTCSLCLQLSVTKVFAVFGLCVFLPFPRHE